MLLLVNISDCNKSRTPLLLGTYLNNVKTDIGGNDEKSFPTTHFQQLVGCLLHLCNTTLPDIAYAAGYLSRLMHIPPCTLWDAAKQGPRYLKGTRTLGSTYSKTRRDDHAMRVVGFSDSDWGQERPSRKLISGYVFMFSSLSHGEASSREFWHKASSRRNILHYLLLYEKPYGFQIFAPYSLNRTILR